MVLARDLTLLEVGFNFDRLYAGGDPDYEVALRAVRDGVNTWHREHQPAGAEG